MNIPLFTLLLQTLRRAYGGGQTHKKKLKRPSLEQMFGLYMMSYFRNPS